MAGAVLGAITILFGLVGMNGAHEKDSGQIRIFAQFLLFALLVCFGLAVMDYVVLSGCEDTGMDLTKGERNPTMDILSRTGMCMEFRTGFLVFAVIHFLLTLFFYFEVKSLVDVMTSGLGHKIRW
eukprot:CAMPEP_0204257294 /NCGR_PEP_ID=MMETSP0468-20130131/4334_1 /ASSEMBLY_ACC=CAM_ASM_000383 /TAXON_ID=2969 /ORGANISM="Oxyrrhis marina" /LENGTH=124 /DNA_ID=CAMNT_0051231393 /DNA_START=309 /DNA_END=680 /DNA_ORIENTATION=+